MDKSQYYLVNFDPVAFSLGPLSVHWYGVMYLVAFLACWGVAYWRAKKLPFWGWRADEFGDFLFYGMVGVILGGRLGYVLIYGLPQWADDWLFPIKLWQGGMSFHGGLIGVILAIFWYARKTQRSFFQVGDFVSVVVPLGLAIGRLGNFIGGELWGRKADVPWAMIFPKSFSGSSDQAWLSEAYASGLLDTEARHPSQLYQAGLEGLALFFILLWFARRPRPSGAVSGLFLIGYAVFRFLIEFFRQPDEHIGFVALNFMTMGQLLSFPMFGLGLLWMYWAYRRAPSNRV